MVFLDIGKNTALSGFRFILVLVTALMMGSHALASHGPLPIPPEGTIYSASINIYGPSGTLFESINALETGSSLHSFLGPGEVYTYTTNSILNSYDQFQVFSGLVTLDFADGNTANGIDVPFFLDVGQDQRGYQYIWDYNGHSQVVIGLFDIINVAGLWTVTSVDTDPNDSSPGTAFLAGPLAGFSVTWDMTLTAPLPAGIWLFLSALIPLSFGKWKKHKSKH